METLDCKSNPWLVENISDFSYFCCPECDYRTKAEDFFEHHAVNKHPSSIEFFSSEVTDQQSGDESFSIHIKKEGIDDDDSSKVVEEDLEVNNDAQRLSPKIEVFPVMPDSDKQIVHDDDAETDIEGESKEKEVRKSRKWRQTRADPSDTSHQQCSKCNEVLIGFYRHSLHLKKVHGKDSELWPCSVCDKLLKTHNILEYHIKYVHLKMKVKCDICGAELSGPVQLRTHMKSVHIEGGPKKTFKCKVCDYATHTLNLLKHHVKAVHEKDSHNLKCDQCDKMFYNQSRLTRHKVQSHQQGSARYVCDTCGKGYKIEESFKNHTQSNACKTKGPFKCDRCEKEFTEQTKFVNHYKTVHKAFPLQCVNKEQFMCDQCPSTYSHQGTLRNHIKIMHSGIKKPRDKAKTCTQCDKTFASRTWYYQHPCRRKNRTPYKCNQCDKSYGSNAGLQKHANQVHHITEKHHPQDSDST